MVPESPLPSHYNYKTKNAYPRSPSSGDIIISDCVSLDTLVSMALTCDNHNQTGTGETGHTACHSLETKRRKKTFMELCFKPIVIHCLTSNESNK